MILESHPGPLRTVPRVLDGLQMWVSEHASATIESPDAGEATVEVESPVDGRVSVILKTALGSAVGYWHPKAGNERALVPDWAGAATVSAIDSAPIGVLYDRQGESVFWFATDSLITVTNLTWGVAEEDGTFALKLDLAVRAGRPITVRLGHSGGFSSVIGEAAAWMGQSITHPAAPVPLRARQPVYSTWYAYHEGIDEEALESESIAAAKLGFGSVFLDFGWQMHGNSRYFDGCGDWYPDPSAFPDLEGSVRRLAGRGLDCVLWVAPLMLGFRSAASREWEQFAPHYSESLRVRVLDPRHPEVRAYIVDTCVRLMRNYGIAGLKIDFVDIAMVYAGTASNGDIDDVGAAMVDVFAKLAEAFRVHGWDDAYVEFRQPYVSPALAPFGNLIRAGDCPGDAVANRTSIIDARMFATHQIVHSDMVMWARDAAPEAVAWQLHNAFFAVPQVSVRLDDMTPDQRSVLQSVLRLSKAWGDVAAFGELTVPGSHARFPLVRSEGADGRIAISMFEPTPILLEGSDRSVIIINPSGGRVVVARRGAATGTARVRIRDLFGDDVSDRTVELSEAFVELPIPACGWAEISVGIRPIPSSPQGELK